MGMGMDVGLGRGEEMSFGNILRIRGHSLDT